ncbi:MerR family transcriptional regulator [Jannaschia pohangensis]|uniref:MerR HTH family regulatory protein n=1 Tax=Jannaschia pohangensis TaxID=390807 RepID=A0A1I3SB07_9RHOB|nr:MerR family transcriptional regulator [Jannaschia pohangensis]SFJ55928.1 MerR HTH family regulatory protein [Jannaschia pohangensis]
MAQPPEKSDGAFRTISEVADWLGVRTHVLRFWESKIDQIAPVKGAGGRRYYRPEDMRLLGGIKVMLHDQGLPIRGVSQKIEEEGADAVMRLSPDLDVPETPPARTRRVIRAGDDAEGAKIVPFDNRTRITPEGDDTAPDAMPAQPDAPVDTGESPPQVDEPAPPQPDDGPIEEPAAPAQPDVATETAEAPVDVPPPATFPTPEPGPAAEPTTLSAAITQAQATISLGPLEQRRLRRIIRKLRGLIEEVEAEMDTGPNR